MKRYWLAFVDLSDIGNSWKFQDDNIDFLIEGSKLYLANLGYFGKFKVIILDSITDKIDYRTVNVI